MAVDGKITYPIEIRWTRECNLVSVSGSFNNWGEHIKMDKKDDGKAFGMPSIIKSTNRKTFVAITLNVLPGVYSYK